MHEAIKLEEVRAQRLAVTGPPRPEAAGRLEPLSSPGGPGAQSRASPDGTRIAFIWDRADLSDVYVIPPPAAGRDVSTHRALTAYWSDEVPRWSPDGAWLAFTMDDHVHVAPAGGASRARSATLRPRRPRRCGCPTAGASSSAWNRTTAPSWC
ncbi:MAG: hypothetical protein R3A10_19770 [Caldilineaceae bacterium]